MGEFTFSLQRSGEAPLYEQLYRYVVEEIRSGRLREGEKLPSKRALCAHLNVSQSTVETAYGLLAAEGYVTARPRSGYVVCPVVRLAEPESGKEAPKKRRGEARESALSDCFSTGAVDTSVFPFSSWARLNREAVYQHPELLQRGHRQGDLPLRETLCDFLHQYRGVSCQPEQIVVGAGMEYLLTLLLELLPAGAALALEDPGYHAVYQAAGNLGRTCVPIPVDGRGMAVEALEQSGADVAYVTPSHQFPLGVTMPVGRRTELLRWAGEKPGRFLIEDDYDSEFRYTSRPIPALQGLDKNGRVVYIGTFSRSIAPSIRVAYLILPPELLEKYQRMFARAASTVSRFEQEVLRQFIARGLYGRHLRRVGNLYRVRRSLLLEGLSELPEGFVSGADAGLHFLLHLPGMDEGEAVERVRRAGCAVHGLGEYCHLVRPEHGALVLGFAGLEEETAEENIRKLLRALEQ